jgi:hypothetical protein
MGTGIIKAVAEVFPDTRDLICHFHFLRDIGKDFLNPAYGELRKRLRSHAMTFLISCTMPDTHPEVTSEYILKFSRTGSN